MWHRVFREDNVSCIRVMLKWTIGVHVIIRLIDIDKIYTPKASYVIDQNVICYLESRYEVWIQFCLVEQYQLSRETVSATCKTRQYTCLIYKYYSVHDVFLDPIPGSYVYVHRQHAHCSLNTKWTIVRRCSTKLPAKYSPCS